MDLLRRSLCEDSADYESLIANMSIVLSTLDCNDMGQIIMTQPGSVILTNMFKPEEPNKGFWKGCFNDREVYYYDKSCGQQSKTYLPPSGSDPCATEAQTIAVAFLPAIECNTNNAVLEPGISTWSITHDQDGTNVLTEITTVTFSDNLAIGESTYLSLWNHCNTVNYIFWTGTEPSLGGASTSLIYIEYVSTVVQGFGYSNALRDAILASQAATEFTLFQTSPGGGDGVMQITTVIPNPLPVVDPSKYTFKIIADAYSCYLGSLTGAELLEDVQKVMLSFCQLLKDRIGFDRVLNKTMLTIGKCDL
jgi:hypothetical protein